MAGTFGYELDVSSLSEEEKEEIRRQLGIFRKYYDIIQYGDYYRLTSPFTGSCTVWEKMCIRDRGGAGLPDDQADPAAAGGKCHTPRAQG